MDKAAATVLVVDDEPDVRTLCRVNLEYEGYMVLESPSGEDALSMLQDSRPDLILLDLMMPRMDGWEVLRKLKEDDKTASIPVVLLTARADDESQLKGWSEGIVDYIIKPFNPLSLVRYVQKALTERSPESETKRRDEIVQQLKRMKDLKDSPEEDHGA
jgi:two-component system phosphate regulon response regulator PhoB